jgi:predicted peptidase
MPCQLLVRCLLVLCLLASAAIVAPAITPAQEPAVQEPAVQNPALQNPAAPKTDRSPGAQALPVDLYEARKVSVREGDATVEFAYRLLAPEPAATTGDGARHPLIVFLHGAGERGSDNVAQLKYLPAWMAEPENRRRHPAFVLAPQCRMDERWVDVSWADGSSTPQPPTPTTDLAAAIAAIDAVVAREAVDPARIYLTGLSMGGYGTWDLAARSPERFAAVMPICGGGDERVAARLAGLPIWCFHGDADKAVPVGRSREMIAAVRRAGGRPIYSELAGVGHDSWTPAYRDGFVLDWLFSQRK